MDSKLNCILDYLRGPLGEDKVILVDLAGNQLEFTESLQKMTTASRRIGVTSSKDLYMDRSFVLFNRGFTAIELRKLVPAEVIAIAQLHAKRRGKHLDVRTQDAIRKKQSSLNPYYLSLILQQLFMMNEDDFKAAEALAPGMEGLSLYFQQLIDNMPDDLEEMSIHTLNWAFSKAEYTVKGLDEDASLMSGMDAVIEIARSKDGLTISELEEIAAKRNKRFLPMEFHRLLCMMYDSFHQTNSGRWKCSSNILRKSILHHFNLVDVVTEDPYQLIRLKLDEADTFKQEYMAITADTKPSELDDDDFNRAHLCLFRSIQLYEELLQEYQPYLTPEELKHVRQSLLYTTGQRIDLRLAFDVVNWSEDRWVPIYLGKSVEFLDNLMESDLAHQAELAEDKLQLEEAFRRSEIFYEKLAMRPIKEPVPETDPMEEKRKFYAAAYKDHKDAIDFFRSGDIARGSLYAHAFVLHLYTNTELFEELIAPEPCLSFYREVAGYRKAASSLDRSYQVHWMQIADFGVANCLRLLDREKDVKWLKEGLSIAKAQRDYMEGLMGTSKNGDDFWYLQHIWYTYRMEQDLYMEMADNDIAPEEKWLPAMLETVDEQLSIPKVCVGKDDQKKVLDRLYLLKAKGLKNQAGLQQAIDKITERLGDSDNTFAFTLQKTAIEQNAVAEANTFDILDSIFGDSDS